MKYRFGFRYWREPTPVKIRRIASAIGAGGIAGCGFAYLRDNIPLAIALLICAVAGSFVSKLFADKP
jgi:hypothetical protein